MTIATFKWTVQDYHSMIDAGILVDRAVELLNGEVIELSPEGPEHYYCSNRAADCLRRLLGQNIQVRLNGPLTLSDVSEPQPDIAVVKDLGSVYRTRHPDPSETYWVIEFAKTSLRKDTHPKRQAYAKAGIPEYWVVNLGQRVVTIYRNPVNGDYQDCLDWQEGTIELVALPQVAIDVAQFLG